MAFQHLSLFCCCLLLGSVLGTFPVSVEQAKRDPSHKPDKSPKVTLDDLTVELAKTQGDVLGSSSINLRTKGTLSSKHSSKLSVLDPALELAKKHGDVLDSSSINLRTKGTLSSKHSSKLSVKDLALELAKKHLLRMIVDEQHDLEKTKESGNILQRDSCTNIKSVSEPVTHNARRNKTGAWMKDPLGIMGTETIFVMKSYQGNVLEEFENMDTFKAGVTRKNYTLPYPYDGTGAVVYGPYLYYNREYSSYIIKFSLRTERIEATINVNGYSVTNNGYAWGGGSSMDLAVDEQGLWLLWAGTGKSDKLNASKIDVYQNVITQTWSLDTEPMSSMGNAFVACGVIYCIDSLSNKSTTINFAYDTKTGQQWNPNIKFTNQYGYNSMVDYNPRERMLYAWDDRRQVTYSLTFEEH